MTQKLRDSIRRMYLKALFVAYMMQHVGTYYRWGGNHVLEGVDCSGFAQVSLAAWGLDPRGDQNAQALHDHFRKSQNGYIAKESVPIGALVFFGRSTRTISHVGVSVGFGFMAEAAGGDSTVTTPERAKEKGAYIKFSPIDRRRDLVAVLVPRDLPWAKPERSFKTILAGLFRHN